MRQYRWVEHILYLIIAVIVIAAVYSVATKDWTPQSAIDVFSTRFDECMATEKFTRDECIVYAKGE